MKKILATILAICAGVIVVNAQKTGTMKISGEITGIPSSYLIVRGSVNNDSVKVIDGKFSATIEYNPLNEMTLAVPQPIEGGTRLVHIISIFPEPGEVTISGSYNDVQSIPSSGTPLNDRYTKLRLDHKAISDEFMAAGNMDRAAQARMLEKLIPLYVECAESNLNNLLGVYCTMVLFNSSQIDESVALMSQLSNEMKQTQQIQQMSIKLATIERQNKIRNSTSEAVPEIAQTTTEGVQVSLLETCAKNKYVLLDFWASWCGPCIAEMPALTKAYADFKDKGFEIYGVSLDDNKNRWEDAIGSYGMTWINVGDLRGWQNAAAVEYGVNSIPANFLLDSNGHVVAHGLRGEALSQKLESLFGQQ